MPLYEDACRSCTHRFEALVRTGATPRCPACEGSSWSGCCPSSP